MKKERERVNRLVPKFVNEIKTKAQMFHQKLSPPKAILRWAVDDLRALRARPGRRWRKGRVKGK